MNQSPKARTIITEGEVAALSVLATLFASRSPNPDQPDDLRGFRASDLELVYGHGCILSTASSVLGSMIKTAAQNSVILIPDVDSATLTEVFRFIYTGKVEDLQKHEISLLAASKKFHLNALLLLCARSISKTLPPEQAHYHLAGISPNFWPDLCLLTVFDHFSLNDLFLITSVCSRWRGLLKSACCRRRELALFVGHDARRLLLSEHRSMLEIPVIDDEDDNKNLMTIPSNLKNEKNNKSFTGPYLFFYHQVPERLATWFCGLTRLRLELMTDVNGLVLDSLATLVLTAEHYRSQLTSLHLNLALSHTVMDIELASLFTQMSSSCSTLTELTLICRRLTSRMREDSRGLGLLLVQPPVIGSLRSLTYHCSFPFDIGRFKQSVHTGMPHLARLALYSPFFSFNQQGAEMVAMQGRPSLYDLRAREPYRELLSAPNALPPSIFTNLGVQLRYDHEHDGQQQQPPFTGLRSLKLINMVQPSLLPLMATLAACSLDHCLEHLDLRTSLMLTDQHHLQPLSSVSFPRLTVLEVKFGYGYIYAHLEHWVLSASVLATLCPRLRVLQLELEGDIGCPNSAALVCPLQMVQGTSGAGAAARNNDFYPRDITRHHLACIRPTLDEIWNASGANRREIGNDSSGSSDSESSTTAPPSRPPPLLLPELRRLLVRFADSQHFEHWPDLVRENDNNDNDNQNKKKKMV